MRYLQSTTRSEVRTVDARLCTNVLSASSETLSVSALLGRSSAHNVELYGGGKRWMGSIGPQHPTPCSMFQTYISWTVWF